MYVTKKKDKYMYDEKQLKKNILIFSRLLNLFFHV